MTVVPVARSDVRLLPDPARVIVKPFTPGEYTDAAGDPASVAVLERVLALGSEEVSSALDRVHTRFGARHAQVERLFEEGFARVRGLLADTSDISRERRLLAGSCFVHEYAIEAAALTNPSIVPAPDQAGLAPAELRFVMSLRGIGEGHRSCIEFRTGRVDAQGTVSVDDPGATPVTGTAGNGESLTFQPETDLPDRVLFPRGGDERMGMEDARFVRFTEEDGSVRYLATYTAFDGVSIRPRLLETDGFTTFRFGDLTGEAARDKGMALFPRRIDGRYAALSRHDDQSNHLVFSDDLCSWGDPVRLQAPARGWELIKLGNGGSPLETEAGWLVITHAVGPFREYVLGALLLDLDDPARVVGSLDAPLLAAADDDRDGYVPNVVYSCGGLIHDRLLVLPFGFADRGVGVATVRLEAVLERLR